MKQEKEKEIKFAGQLCLSTMGVWPPAIYSIYEGKWSWTNSDGVVCSYENAPTKWRQAVRRVEEEREITVYHVTHSVEWFGECLNLLFIPDQYYDSECLVERLTSGVFRVYAYVINLDNPRYSEPGCIIVDSSSGGLSRVDTDPEFIRSLNKGMSRNDFLKGYASFYFEDLVRELMKRFARYKRAVLLTSGKEIRQDMINVVDVCFGDSVNEPDIVTFEDGTRYAYSYPYSFMDMWGQEIPAESDITEMMTLIRQKNEGSE